MCGRGGQTALHFGGTEPENIGQSQASRRSVREFGSALPSIPRLCGWDIWVRLPLLLPHPCCKNQCFSRSVISVMLTERTVSGKAKAKEGLWTATCLVGVSRRPDLQGRVGQGLHKGFVNRPGHQSLLGENGIFNWVTVCFGIVL